MEDEVDDNRDNSESKKLNNFGSSEDDTKELFENVINIGLQAEINGWIGSKEGINIGQNSDHNVNDGFDWDAMVEFDNGDNDALDSCDSDLD